MFGDWPRSRGRQREGRPPSTLTALHPPTRTGESPAQEPSNAFYLEVGWGLFGEGLMVSQGPPGGEVALVGQMLGIQGAPVLCGTLSCARTASEQGILPSRSGWSPSKTHFSACIQGLGSGSRQPFPPALLCATPLFCTHAWDSEATVPLLRHALPSTTLLRASPSFVSGANPLPPHLSLGTCPHYASSPAQWPLGKGHAEWGEAAWGQEGGKSWIRGSEGSAEHLPLPPTQ